MENYGSPVRPKRSVDGFLPPRSQQQPMMQRMPPKPSQTAHTQPSARPKVARTQQTTPFWKKILTMAGQTVLFTTLLILGLLIQSALIGQLVIIFYAIAAFVWRISSRTTFLLVLGCFAVVLFASIKSDVSLAATFAMYAFLLLVVGTISLAREVRSEI